MAHGKLFCAETRKKPKHGKASAALFLIFLPVIFAVLVSASVLPKVEKTAAAAARNAASAQIDKAVLKYMEENEITYGNLVDIHYDSSGAIASVTADSAKIDVLVARMDDEIGKELEETVEETRVPLNVLFGAELIAGGGPKIKIHYFPIDIANVRVRHEFVSEGINQTLHTIYLDISVDIEILFPLKNKKESIDTELLLGQTLIVGSVPSTYVER